MRIAWRKRFPTLTRRDIIDRMKRRKFLSASGVAVAASAMPAPVDKPAMLGGSALKLVGDRKWPVFDETEERALLAVLRSGKWYRGYGQTVRQFETQYAALTGAKHCLAVANGTSALVTSLNALGIGAGDEVILPPYTFVATLNAVLERHAMPVFADIDRRTFQVDPKKMEAAITPRTKALLPVHIGGSAFDLDAILAIGRKHGIPVIEDACQAHLGEWRGRKVGSWGTVGCFSFQASKNLNSGEGGAVLTDDDQLIGKLSAFHNNSGSMHGAVTENAMTWGGLNLRMPEFQAALLISQMTRLEEQSKRREQNAAYLTSMLKEIPGVHPAEMYEGCTRNAYHLYMFRYDAAQFAGLSRVKLLKALSADGVPASAGYTPLNKQPLLRNVLSSRGFAKVYGTSVQKWDERNSCPENDRLCEEALWLTQTTLLGPRSDMETIAAAIRKIQRHASALA